MRTHTLTKKKKAETKRKSIRFFKVQTVSTMQTLVQRTAETETLKRPDGYLVALRSAALDTTEKPPAARSVKLSENHEKVCSRKTITAS